ncbi:MAG TPA: LacI family DNA-binding transcriptional regulator [Opitutaceae bacterium]|nr:LacI family DNA-binding transcriptional regulator [Opitutaceae bacterium]
MAESVTMKEISVQAGVSQATVSLSLANHPRIPAATRGRIQALARKLGYRTNPYVAALMRSRRRGRPLPGRPVLAVICAQDRPDGWRTAPGHTMRQALEAALRQAAARGYEGQEVWLHKDDMSNARFSEMLRARGIQGVLLGPLPPGETPPELRWDFFSVVRVGVPLHTLPLRAVCHDHFYGSMTAVQECLRLGYRRPGLLLLESHNANLQHRWEAGFRSALAALATGQRLAPLVCPHWPEGKALRDWLHRRRPDVIITPDHETVGRALASIGCVVPGDVGLVSLACPEEGGRITGIHQNGRLIGASAADMLIDLVERHERGYPAHGTALMIEGRWVPGQMVRRT